LASKINGMLVDEDGKGPTEVDIIPSHKDMK